MLTSNDIRERFLRFFREHGHEIVPSAPLVPENDPTTLFTGSGMQPIIPYLLGEPHPSGTRIADAQKCFRSQDIEEVGDNRHTTFFEMLGNWSFGDYFKKEQIPWMWKFLTEEIGLNPGKLCFTCFRGNDELGIPKDTESAQSWQKLFEEAGIEAKIGENSERDGIRENERIFYYSEKKNWWSRAGIPTNMPEGEPGGPDTEMFWDFGAEHGLHEQSAWKDVPCHVNCDCGRFMEIGNNVFMEYRKTAHGFEKLAQRNVDFGGGLERLLAAANDIPDVLRLDMFDAARTALERLSGVTYGSEEKTTYAMRVILDHLRAATFLIGDGVFPSNKDQGYFVRRLIRRSVRFGLSLGITSDFTTALGEAYIATYAGTYPALLEEKEHVLGELSKEEEKFRKTLENGLHRLEKFLNNPEGNHLSGKDAFPNEEVANMIFDLYQTYGFPPELTFEELRRRNISYDAGKLDIFLRELLTKHEELSRTASAGKFKGGLADHGEKVTALHTATHLMLAGLRKHLGDHVHQAGSNITEERTRFDFTHPEKVPRETLDLVEAYVNEAIAKRCPITMEQLSKADAKSRGIEGSFWEKYPETVNVYTAKSDDGTLYSAELCGGPHVENTGDIEGTFRIIKEEASSAGIRRIKAVLG